MRFMRSWVWTCVLDEIKNANYNQQLETLKNGISSPRFLCTDLLDRHRRRHRRTSEERNTCHRRQPATTHSIKYTNFNILVHAKGCTFSAQWFFPRAET